LLGRIGFDRCLKLQERIARDVAASDDGRICLLLGEHLPVLTVGRSGSAAEIHAQAGLLRNDQVPLRWVKRGGGSMIHAPGQLFVYPIIPLDWHGFTVGDYLARLQDGVLRVLEELAIPCQTRADCHGVWGRAGQIVALGVAVRHGIAYHGAVVNVSPPMGLFRLIQADEPQSGPFSTLVAERGQPVKMTTLRASMVRHLAEAFGCQRYHLHTGHPWLQSGAAARRQAAP
jgi:lipoate-protein ligase B